MKLTLNNVRLSFPQLDKPRAFNTEQEPRFSAHFIIEKSQTKELEKVREAIRALVNETWKGKSPGSERLCLREGNTKEYDGYGDDVMFLAANSPKRPVVVARDRSAVTPSDAQWPYAGCYVNGVINLWAQDNQYGKRVNAELLGVQFWNDGEAFGGGGQRASEDDFVDGGEEEYDESEDLAG